MIKINQNNKKILCCGRAKNGTYTMSNKMYGSVMATALAGESISSLLNMINEFLYYSNSDNKSYGPTRYNAKGTPFRPRLSRSLQQSYIGTGPEYF